MKSQTSHMFGHQKRYPRKRMTVVIFRVSRVSKTQTFPLRTNHDGGANLSEVLTWKKKDCRSNLWILLWLGTEIFQVSHKSYVSCLFSFCWFVRWFFFFFFFFHIWTNIYPYFTLFHFQTIFLSAIQKPHCGVMGCVTPTSAEGVSKQFSENNSIRE